VTSVVFVTPAFQRLELTAICLEQRSRVIDHLVEQGIEAQCVVIADDENLDVARAFGFDIVEQNNEYLGRKFNDGMQWAGEHGADWIVPIGSDSWIDPQYFLPLPDPPETRTSALYCAVTDSRLAELRSQDRKGIGPYMFHRSLLETCGFRPASDTLHKSIDRSTVQGINQQINWVENNLHPFQYIGFRGIPHLTPYDLLVEKLGVREHTDPWTILSGYYPTDLVTRVRRVLTMQYEAVNG
jgi:hypothetical protein